VHISLLLLRPHRLAGRLSVAVTKTLTLSWLAQVVAAKLDDGNLCAAVRILCSEDSPAQPSLDADLAKLHAMQLCDAPTSHHQTAVSHCTSMSLSYARQLCHSLLVQQVIQTVFVHST